MDSALFNFCLWMGDSSLILGHRLSEWTGHGPILEEDIAMTNIGLDLVGQATSWLTLAGEIEGAGRSEDDLAYLRDLKAFKNALLVEQLNGDFGTTMMRQYLFDVYQMHLMKELSDSKDERLAAIASKSLKEIKYHIRHSSAWIKRLGDGTAESHDRVQNALNALWMFTDDLFESVNGDQELIDSGIIPNLSEIKKSWEKDVMELFKEATLEIPEKVFMMKGSRNGIHTEHLGFLLAEMQFLPRAYPDAKW
ncbi:MAG: phenylacetate-CoA oxygenase subunit PaaC [Flavobacteriales bacterium]|nr:phenylacetate-CoA oxygenase subunit PaaC [Flavobacteriales bacterium]